MSSTAPESVDFSERYAHLEDEVGPGGFERIFRKHQRRVPRSSRHSFSTKVRTTFNSIFRDTDPYIYDEGFVMTKYHVMVRAVSEDRIEIDKDRYLDMVHEIGQLASYDPQLREELSNPKSSLIPRYEVN